MSETLSGINEEKIYDYADKINVILSSVEDLVDSTKEYYVCDSADLFRNRFLEFKDNFKIVNDNILSLTTEFTSVKNNYYRRVDKMVKDINTYSNITQNNTMQKKVD